MSLFPLSGLQPEPELRPAGALDERRRFPRLPVGAMTLYAGGYAYAGRGDISVGGALWKGHAPPVMDTEVVLGLRLPGLDREVRVKAAVCQVRAAGELTGEFTGVHTRFTRLPQGVEEAIARCVDDWFLIADASGLIV